MLVPTGDLEKVRRIALLTVALACCGSALWADDQVHYTRDIRPLLAQHCFACHGPDDGTREAGLRLDRREDAIAELDSGLKAIVPGDLGASELWTRVSTNDADLRMPPASTGRTLTDEELNRLRRWIAAGAEYQSHWSFERPRRHPLPAVGQTDWPRNEIDHFVLARLEREGIAPAPEAERSTLIRRLSLDLLGLPPTLEEVEEFQRDASEAAYQRLVDRLLDSPHFGERWGRHWLDLARYADSDGYLGDDLRPHAYRYRDWVIDAINRDLPFDQFTIEQLAGDLLPEATLKQRTATGFHRNALKNTEAGADREEDRVKRTVDRVSTTGTVWLGLTVGCAECHSHKFDPISQREFYGLYAFFNNVEDRDLSAVTVEEQASYEAARQRWQDEIGKVSGQLEQSLGESWPEWRQKLLPILDKLVSRRKTPERDKLANALESVDESTRKLVVEYERLAAAKPAAPAAKVMALAETNERRATHLHVRGDFRNLGEAVVHATPAVLHPLQPRGDQPDRLDLAQWLVDPANPLTPRTAVNHLWQHLFGRGLVATVDDFGAMGDAPSHPELLDWLAQELIERGWSRKAIIRLIVTSATYRQSSRARPELAQRDPFNALLARQARYRLEAETIRDVALATSGLLNRQIGGPSVRPPLDETVTNISRNKDWKVSPGDEKYRRGMYILFRRATPFPMLTTFDAPDTTVTCARRERTNSPLQALTLLNDQAFVECAQHLAQQLDAPQTEQSDAWLRDVFRRCLSREPTEAEWTVLKKLYGEQLALIRGMPTQEQRALAGELDTRDASRQKDPAPLELRAAKVAMIRILMNLDEFITRQ
jgi:hypothetical protein